MRIGQQRTEPCRGHDKSLRAATITEGPAATRPLLGHGLDALSSPFPRTDSKSSLSFGRSPLLPVWHCAPCEGPACSRPFPLSPPSRARRAPVTRPNPVCGHPALWLTRFKLPHSHLLPSSSAQVTDNEDAGGPATWLQDRTPECLVRYLADCSRGGPPLAPHVVSFPSQTPEISLLQGRLLSAQWPIGHVAVFTLPSRPSERAVIPGNSAWWLSPVGTLPEAPGTQF